MAVSVRILAGTIGFVLAAFKLAGPLTFESPCEPKAVTLLSADCIGDAYRAVPVNVPPLSERVAAATETLSGDVPLPVKLPVPPVRKAARAKPLRRPAQAAADRRDAGPAPIRTPPERVAVHPIGTPR